MARWLAAGAGAAAGAYGAYVAQAWLRYGRPARLPAHETDSRLDAFMPSYDVAERHHVRIGAPADVTLALAREMDLQAAPIVRAIIRTRELLLGATPDTRARPRGLVAEVLDLGWGVLADVPGHELVMGAVTQPWEANVVFRALAPEEFASFREPGYVKIAWTLRTDPVGDAACVFRTETRAVATDDVARAKFRRYWAFLSPGIIIIRRATLGSLKRAAEGAQENRRSGKRTRPADRSAV